VGGAARRTRNPWGQTPSASTTSSSSQMASRSSSTGGRLRARCPAAVRRLANGRQWNSDPPPCKARQEGRKNMSASARFRRVASAKADANVAGAGPAGRARQNSRAGGTVRPAGDPNVRPKSWWATAHSARPARVGGRPGYDCDVVVVGGGPAGAAAAARLAGAGFATVVVDRASFPRDKVCGDFVGPAALAELADLGVTGTAAVAATNTIGECARHLYGDRVGGPGAPPV